jgi:alginate O-acetyltransferase complex protein AlgI
VFVDDVYRAPGAYSSFTIFLAIVSYAMQIYFDFSGYSDMAVGAAKCLGYDLPRNFNLPYLSKNITEFWKRWHISLSTWFMNYLYYSLAQNRKGNVRLKSYVNLIITMLLCGLWHGASFAFIVFGGLHGLLLCAHKLFSEIIRKRKKKLKKQGIEKERSKAVTIIISGVSIFLTASFASMVFVFFRAGDIGDAFIIFGRLFTFQDGINQPFSWAFISLAILICGYIIAAIKSKQNIGKQGKIEYEGYYPIFNLEKIWGLAIVIAAAGLIAAFAYTGNNPFVYFQF